MARRIRALDPNKFTAFVFLVLLESEDAEDVLSDDELLQTAREIFEDSDELAQAATVRFEGFIKALDHPGIQPYIHHGSKGMQFHPALLSAAATCRTRSNGSLPDKVLTAKTNEIRQREYEDFSFTS